MIDVKVEKQSNYAVSASKLKKRLKTFLEEKGVESDFEVSVAIVSEEEMKKLGKRYLKEDTDDVHNVLSFPATETKGKFVFPPDEKIRLGEIVVCYPKAVEEAKQEGKLIDERIGELVEHGALHLLGEHHD